MRLGAEVGPARGGVWSARPRPFCRFLQPRQKQSETCGPTTYAAENPESHPEAFRERSRFVFLTPGASETVAYTGPSPTGRPSHTGRPSPTGDRRLQGTVASKGRPSPTGDRRLRGDRRLQGKTVTYRGTVAYRGPSSGPYIGDCNPSFPVVTVEQEKSPGGKKASLVRPFRFRLGLSPDGITLARRPHLAEKIVVVVSVFSSKEEKTARRCSASS